MGLPAGPTRPVRRLGAVIALWGFLMAHHSSCAPSGGVGGDAQAFVQPGCNIMYEPGASCSPFPSFFVTGCCPPRYSCLPDPEELGARTCQYDAGADLSYSYAINAGDDCGKLLPVGGQCGGTGGSCSSHDRCSVFGPWRGFCCPNGFSCKPQGTNLEVWRCQADQGLGEGHGQARIDLDRELLQYPPRPLLPDACTCRQNFDKERIPMACPSPWNTEAGYSQAPPPLKVAPGGRLVVADTGADAYLQGVNWFGWNVGNNNFDGFWAYCDDNVTYSTPPCPQDGDIPPGDFPSSAIGGPAQLLLNTSYWGKRSMTNDFAQVVYRLKLLGFNAIRVPFQFAMLQQDIPPPVGEPSEFFTCMRDGPKYIARDKTLDPELAAQLKAAGGSIDAILPPYQGMPHPPPRNLNRMVKPRGTRQAYNTGTQTCTGPWEAPFLSNYTGGRGKEFRLTQCNWYLPQGPKVQALHRFLWQLQYLVSQGFYLMLDFNSNRDVDPNLSNPQLLAANWANLWHALTDLPAWPLMKGRVFPDFINEPSRWGCQWGASCTNVNNSLSCAPGVELYGQSLAAVWRYDYETPVFLNGMGQDNSSKWDQCGNYYPGMHWGDGFITSRRHVRNYAISDASPLFASGAEGGLLGGWLPLPFQLSKPDDVKVVLAPHVYPGSITGAPKELEEDPEVIRWRWDLSWGLKAAGDDKRSNGRPIGPTPLVIGEFGVKDWGNNRWNNSDTTYYPPRDRAWLKMWAAYLRDLSSNLGRPVSWFWWAWNANSSDTKGLVGPNSTWREIQWTKVRLLIREFGLRPWYCRHYPTFCETVEWERPDPELPPSQDPSPPSDNTSHGGAATSATGAPGTPAANQAVKEAMNALNAALDVAGNVGNGGNAAPSKERARVAQPRPRAPMPKPKPQPRGTAPQPKQARRYTSTSSSSSSSSTQKRSGSSLTQAARPALAKPAPTKPVALHSASGLDELS